MGRRIGDRLHAVRASRFVGRTAELAEFAALLAAAEPEVSVVFVHGPGGVGKTTLLRRFADLGRDAGLRVLEVDARDLAPTAADVRAALAPAAESGGRHLLLLDTYELLSHLDDWLRTDLLAGLPGDTLVVLAGRDAPSAGWRSDPGWWSLIRPMGLRNLDPDESRTLLQRLGVPDVEHRAVVEFTHGHPLALALVANDIAVRGGPFDAHDAPDVVRTLLDSLVQGLPSREHRTAVEACAQVRTATEPLLAALLDRPEAHQLFHWLRGLSFMEQGRSGIFPHDLAREILAADLRWRDREQHSLLHQRARRYYLRQMAGADEAVQQATLAELLYLHRYNPILGPYLSPLGGAGTGTGPGVDAVRDTDLAALTSMVCRHEGPESAALARHWLERRPSGGRVVRAPGGEPLGFLLLVSLTETGAEDRARDPAVAAAWRYLDSAAPLRPGERATLVRHWLSGDTYQDVSGVQSLLAVELTRHYLTTPALAVTLLPFADSETWAAFCAYADQVRAPQADFVVGGRRYDVFAHDWRAVPPAAWVALLGERETALAPLTISPPTAETVLVLGKEEFTDQVRAALRHFRRRDRLQHNALLRSRLVTSRVGADAAAAERVDGLQAVLREAAQELERSPREARAYRAVHRAYLAPAPSLEQAAEALGLPSSTFRRHLTEGVTRLVDMLWERELGG